MIKSFLQNTAVSVGAGYLADFLPNLTEPICRVSKGDLQNWFCMRSINFFDSENLKKYVVPILELKEWISLPLRAVLPSFRIIASNMQEVLNLVDRASQIPHLKAMLNQSDLPSYLMSCQPRYTNRMIAGCFVEELIFRLFVQKILFRGPARPIPRVLLAAFIFAFSHLSLDKNHFILPHFIAGLIYGAVFEKYGIFASTTAHVVTDFIVSYREKASCEKQNLEVIQKLSMLLGF